MNPGAFHFAKVGLLPRIKTFIASIFDQIAKISRIDQLIFHDIKGRKLLRSRVRPAIRHDRRHVPVQHTANIRQHIHPAKTGFEGFIGFGHHGLLRGGTWQPLAQNDVWGETALTAR